MSMSEEQIEAIKARADSREKADFHFAWTQPTNYVEAQCDIFALLRSIAELRLQSGLDTQRRKEAEMLIHLERADLARAREQVAELSKALEGVPYEAIQGGWNVTQYTEGLKAELRKPVAVEPNAEVENYRSKLDGGFFWYDWDIRSLLSAYDALAQQCARMHQLLQQPEILEKNKCFARLSKLVGNPTSIETEQPTIELAIVDAVCEKVVELEEEVAGYRNAHVVLMAERDRLKEQATANALQANWQAGTSFQELGELQLALRDSLERGRQQQENLEFVNQLWKNARTEADQRADQMEELEERQRQLREALPSLVDITWNEATESEQVPSPDWARRIIQKWEAALTASPAPVESNGIHDLEDMNFELSKAWREAMVDAKRYRRLRILGAAPYTAGLSGTVLRFTNLDSSLDDDIRAHASRGEAGPGHAPAPEVVAALVGSKPAAGGVLCQGLETAPRDGSYLILLVEYDQDDSQHPLYDESPGSLLPTIGCNNFDNDGEDVWQIAGWDWSNDGFTSGRATVRYWISVLPGHPDAALSQEPTNGPL